MSSKKKHQEGHQTNLLSFLGKQIENKVECSTESRSTKNAASKPVQKTYNFQEAWKKEFSWLEYDPDKNSMFCSDCRKFDHLGKRNTIRELDGCNSFRKEVVRAHSLSVIFVTCM